MAEQANFIGNGKKIVEKTHCRDECKSAEKPREREPVRRRPKKDFGGDE